MSHKGKMLELMIRNRILPAVYGENPIVPENQFGFRTNCGTQEPILFSHLLTTSAKEYDVPLYKCYIDLAKAYDKVNRALLWRILTLYGLPEEYLTLIRAMHDGAQAKIRWKSNTSESFPLNRGLKQGSTISPFLWNIFFGVLTTAAEREFAKEQECGVKIWFDMEGAITEQTVDYRPGHHLEAGIWMVCYADDSILFAQSEASMQRMLDIFSNICMAFGMEISVTKTKVMRIRGALEDGIIVDRARREGSPTPRPRDVILYINGERVEAVQQFNYLGCSENEDNTMRTEVAKRQYKMISVFEYYAGTVLQNYRLNVKARICVFKTIIIPNGVYACNTWNLRAKEMDRLERTYTFLLRKTIGVNAKDYEEKGTTHHFDIAKQKGVTIYSLACYIELYQLRYLWKLQRFGEEKLCAMIARGRISSTKRGRKRGRPQVAFRHCLTEALEHFGVSYQEVREMPWKRWIAQLNGPGITLATDRVEILADMHLQPDIVEDDTAVDVGTLPERRTNTNSSTGSEATPLVRGKSQPRLLTLIFMLFYLAIL